MMIWELAVLIVIIALCVYLIVSRICICSERNHKSDITGTLFKEASKFVEKKGKE